MHLFSYGAVYTSRHRRERDPTTLRRRNELQLHLYAAAIFRLYTLRPAIYHIMRIGDSDLVTG